MTNVQVTYHELLTYADRFDIQVIPWERCSTGSKLGAGASMNVFSGTYEVNHKIHNAAFKFIKAPLREIPEKRRSRFLQDIKQEIRIMGCLKGHPHIAQLLGVSFDDHTPILILELAESNLEEYLQERKRKGKPVKWETKLGFMYDIALGLEAIHNARVVHGDLKATNILIYGYDIDQVVAKISDFGFCKTDLSVKEGRTPGYTKTFRSRECFDLEFQEWNGKHMTDVYSYGLVVYQIAKDGAKPFEGYDESEVDSMKKEGSELSILTDILCDETPKEVRKIIMETVHYIPLERLSLDEVKNILKSSEKWNQTHSYEEEKVEFNSLVQDRPQESILISKMNEFSIPSTLKKSIFSEYKLLAEAGDMISMSRLGTCWGYGFGTEQDYSKAVECYNVAANNGDTNALNNLGVCYEHGLGVTKDYIKAVELYEMAAGAGNADAKNNLGNCYYNGYAPDEGYLKAIKLYKEAAEAGNANAQFNLGTCYYNGNGVDIDYHKAVELYEKAAEAGNSNAQNNLGVCYEHGQGVPQNDIKAVELYTKAVEANNGDACYNLGACYENGRGVIKNHAKAAELYAKAVKAGNTSAQYNLVGLVETGHSLPLIERIKTILSPRFWFVFSSDN